MALQISQAQGRSITGQYIFQLANQIIQYPNGVLAQAILQLVKQDDGGKSSHTTTIIKNYVKVISRSRSAAEMVKIMTEDQILVRRIQRHQDVQMILVRRIQRHQDVNHQNPAHFYNLMMVQLHQILETQRRLKTADEGIKEEEHHHQIQIQLMTTEIEL